MGGIGHGRNVTSFKPPLQATKCFQWKTRIARTKSYRSEQHSHGHPEQRHTDSTSPASWDIQTHLSLLKSSPATICDLMSIKPPHFLFVCFFFFNKDFTY